MYYIKELDYECATTGVFSLPALHKKISELLTKKCTKRDGVYIEVRDVFIKEMKASVTGNIICSVRCRVLAFMPKTNEILQAIVKRCSNDTGIFCAFDKVNILIPKRHLGNFIFDNDVFVRGDISIGIGDTISVKIETTRYQVGAYRVIAMLENGCF